jgi:hypothetical protein
MKDMQLAEPAVFFYDVFFDPEDEGDVFLRNVDWFPFNSLLGVISQKTKPYVTTAVRT